MYNWKGKQLEWIGLEKYFSRCLHQSTPSPFFWKERHCLLSLKTTGEKKLPPFHQRNVLHPGSEIPIWSRSSRSNAGLKHNSSVWEHTEPRSQRESAAEIPMWRGDRPYPQSNGLAARLNLTIMEREHHDFFPRTAKKLWEENIGRMTSKHKARRGS
jgi:hypothetical protein